jgi:hypothetical protein
VLGALGYVWLLVAEGAWRTTLLFGVVEPAGHDWATHPSTAVSDLLAPLMSRSAVLGAVVWALAAASLAPLVRGRVVTLELLGILVWAAGLLSAQRLLSQWGEAPPPATGALVAGFSLLVVAALLYRTSSPRRRAGARLGGPPPPLGRA